MDIFTKRRAIQRLLYLHTLDHQIFSITGFTELNVDKNSYTVPQLNMYSFSNSDKTASLDEKINDKKLEPISSNFDMKVLSYDRVISTKEVFIIPFSNYPKGTNERHRFLTAYDENFSFSKTEIYGRYHTSITPGFYLRLILIRVDYGSWV